MNTAWSDKKLFKYFLVGLAILWFLPALVYSQSPAVNWIEGPNRVDLGDNIASLDFASHYNFANAADTRKLMQYIGNPITRMETGLVAPNNSDKEWFMIFEYNPIGYIKGAAKERIDADAILESIKKATDQANQQRIKQGFPALKVLGWHTEPHYDVETNNLVWALLADENGQQIVNYNTRLLGRHGYMSAVLVTDVDTFESLSYDVYEILEGFSFKKGKSYAEYVKGDKIAKLGLAALIAGGTAAAATKFGLLKYLAKGGKFIIMAIFGVLSFIWGAIKAVFGRRPARDTETGTSKSTLPIGQQAISGSDRKPISTTLDKVNRMIAEGKSKDALVLIKSESRGKKLEDLRMAKSYFDLLKQSGKIPELLNHAKTYIDLLLDRSQKSTARDVYLECLKHDAMFSLKPEVHFKISESLAQKGEIKHAINACLRITKKYPEHPVIPEVYFFMARTLNEKMKNKIKAKKIISWAIKKYPEHKSTPMAKRYLDVLR